MGFSRRHKGVRGPTYEDCTLDCANRGDVLEVIEVGDEAARVQALRFGMAEGARVECVTRVPAGPVVLRSGRQEIAVGRELARRIRVRACEGVVE